jgi:ABC-type phosphate transport system substrate-binding protein
VDKNSGNLPEGNIVVVHRRHGSSSTSGTTQYLQQVAKDLNCDNQWPDKMNDGKSVGSTVGVGGKWFVDGSDVAAQGSSGVLAKLRCEV